MKKQFFIVLSLSLVMLLSVNSFAAFDPIPDKAQVSCHDTQSIDFESINEVLKYPGHYSAFESNYITLFEDSPSPDVNIYSYNTVNPSTLNFNTMHLVNMPKLRINKSTNGYVVERQYTTWYGRTYWKHISSFTGMPDKPFYYKSIDTAINEATLHFKWDLLSSAHITS